MLLVDTDYPRCYGVANLAIFIIMHEGAWPVGVEFGPTWLNTRVELSGMFATEASVQLAGYTRKPFPPGLLERVQAFWSTADHDSSR